MVTVVKETDYPFLTARARTHGRLAILFVILGVLVFGVLVIFIPGFGVFFGLVPIFVACYFWSVQKSAKRGIEGEKRVSQTLRSLEDDHHLLDDVTLYPHSGNIDHIVLGPNGIFAIETKNYAGRVSCDGDDWFLSHGRGKKRGRLPSISKQAKRGAKLLHTFLVNNAGHVFFESVFVQPIVVFIRSDGIVRARKATVLVTTLDKLCGSLERTKTSIRFSEAELTEMGRAILNFSVSQHPA